MKKVLSVFLIVVLMLGIMLPISAFAAAGEAEDNPPAVSTEESETTTAPEATSAPEIPEVAVAPETPEATVTPEAAAEPEVTVAPDTLETAVVPENPEAADVPDESGEADAAPTEAAPAMRTMARLTAAPLLSAVPDTDEITVTIDPNGGAVSVASTTFPKGTSVIVRGTSSRIDVVNADSSSRENNIYSSLTSPANHQLSAIEVNGTKYESGATTFTASEDVTVKLLWVPEINSAEITINPPRAGANSSDVNTAGFVSAPSGAPYIATFLGWRQGGDYNAVWSGTFESDNTYYARIRVQIPDGNDFVWGWQSPSDMQNGLTIHGGSFNRAMAVGGDLSKVQEFNVSFTPAASASTARNYLSATAGGSVNWAESTSGAAKIGTVSAGSTIEFGTSYYVISTSAVDLTAVSANGYSFKGWYTNWNSTSPNLISSSSSYTWTLPTDNGTTLTAAFEATQPDPTVDMGLGVTTGGSVTGSWSSSGEVATIGGTGNYSFQNAGTISLTATADSGYTFKGWYHGIYGSSGFVESNDGTLLTSENTYTFSTAAGSSSALQAVFESSAATLTPITSVTVNVTPPAAGTTVGSASGAVSVPSDANYSAGVVYYADDPTAYFEGTSSDTPAPLPNEASFAAGYTYYVAVTLSANDGYMFAQASPYTTVNLTGATLTSGSYLSVTNGYWEGFAFSTGTVVASFTIPRTSCTYGVSVTEGGTAILQIGSGDDQSFYTVNSATNYSADAGETVTLTATPSAGYHFKGWYEGIFNTETGTDGYGFVTGNNGTLVSSNATYTFTASASNDGSGLQAVFEAATGVADAFVDNTVDNSVSYVTGMVHITGTGGTQAGYDTDGTGKTVYSNQANVTYSTPKTAPVQGIIDAAYTQVYTLANACKNNGKGGEFHMSTSESTGRVWDNRVYKTFTYNNATSQWEYTSGSGDTEVYTGEIPSNAGTNTRIHVASGDFGKQTYYRVEANGWVPGYTITVTDDGNGIASADLEASLAGETVTLTATPASGYMFKEWQVISGDLTLTGDSFTMPAADVEIKAIFESAVTYTVTVTASPAAGGTVSGAGTHNGNSSVTVTATPSTGYRFVKWTEDGAEVSTEASYTLTAAGDRALTANFELIPTYTVTVTNDGNGTGTASPASGPEGTEITLTATPNEGYRLKEWQVISGGITVTDNKFTLGSVNVEVKAVFELISSYTVKFSMDCGSDVPDQTVLEGSKATKPADPTKEDLIFDGWYQDATFSVAFDFDTAITADTTIYAKWANADYILTSVTGTTTDASHTWTKGSTSDVVITVKLNDGVDNSFAHFTSFQIDGTTLTRDTDYTAHEGSTVITVKAATMQRLSVGAHTATINFDNGNVQTRLTVKAAPGSTTSPRTGDTSLTSLWAVLVTISGLGLGAMFAIDKKSRYVGKH